MAPETPMHLRRVDDLWRYMTAIVGVVLIASCGWIFTSVTGRVSALESGQRTLESRFAQQDIALALLNQKLDLLLRERGIQPPGPK